MNCLLSAVAGGATVSFMLVSSAAALCQPIPLSSLKPPCTCEENDWGAVGTGETDSIR